LLYPAFPLVGGIIAVLFVWLLGLRRFTVSGLVFGALAILFSLVVQDLLQDLPLLIALRSELAGVTSVEEVQQVVREFLESIGLPGVIGLCLWTGFVAGVVQTGFKYLFISIVLWKSYRGALSLGLSFGFTEAVIVAALALLLASIHSSETTPLWMATLSGVAVAFERFSATLFHVGTSLYIAHTANPRCSAERRTRSHSNPRLHRHSSSHIPGRPGIPSRRHHRSPGSSRNSYSSHAPNRAISNLKVSQKGSRRGLSTKAGSNITPHTTNLHV